MELVRAFAAAKCLQILIAKLGDDHFGSHLRACAPTQAGSTSDGGNALAHLRGSYGQRGPFRETSGYLRR